MVVALWLEAATGLLQTFPYLGLVPLITLQLNGSGNEEEEEFYLLLMGSYFNIKSLPEHSCELCSQTAYQHLWGVSWWIHMSVGPWHPASCKQLQPFVNAWKWGCSAVHKLQCGKKFRLMWRAVTSGLDSKTEHFDFQFRLEYCYSTTSICKLPSS